MKLFLYPPLPVTVSIPPIQFLLDGAATSVSRDTVTPGSSTPLPAIILDDTGNPVDFSGLAAIGPVAKFLSDLDTAPILTSAYTELLASSPEVKKIQVFFQSGQPLFIAFGAPGSEVDVGYISYGGNGLMDFAIPAGTRVSVKAVVADATAAEPGVPTYFIVNFLG